MNDGRTRANVLLLAAQAVSFGLASAFLAIAANGLFLPAYGAEWLPLTYIGVALFGAGASIVIARALRRWTLPAVAVVVLGLFAVTLLVGWAVVVVTGSTWPSIVQLVSFPILIQLGFVIIGGQAGRLLDLQQIKRYFPGVVAGFVVGFTVGGFAAIPVLDLVGDAEHLIVVAAGCSAAFAVLVLVTARRRPFELAVVDQPSGAAPRPSLRSLLTGRFVFLLATYQVLSAIGSQIFEYLVWDRAAARYTEASELAQFVAVYTGILNAVDLVFLVVFAGWLLRRFGLSLGLVANPAGVTAMTLAMLIAALGPGSSSLALFSIVAATRVLDIALSDGTTRGSINAVFQVVPVEARLAVQAGVEGVGVPVAIGATGALLLAMNALDLGTTAIVAVALLVCVAWSVAAVVVYRDYRRALAARLRRRALDLDAALPVAPEEQTAVRRLLLTDDVRDIRLGLDLAVVANLSSADLSHLVDHDDGVVRLSALDQLARRGDEAASSRTSAVARQLASSDDALERRAAAVACSDLGPPDREALLGRLLADPEPTVRIAALDSVGAHDVGLAQTIVAGLDEPSTVEAALSASRRLGTPAITLAVERLNGPDPVDSRLVRLVGASDATPFAAAIALDTLVTHPDRSVSVAALGALARGGATVDASVVDALLAADAELAARALAASTAMAATDGLLRRALEDELTLARDRVLGLLSVRHGEERIGAARRALLSPDGSRRALGVEMLEVSLSRREAALVDPVIRDDLSISERLRRLRSVIDVPDRDRSAWLTDLAVDQERRWRSPWLQAVALYTEVVDRPERAAEQARRVDAASAATAHPALDEVVLAASLRTQAT